MRVHPAIFGYFKNEILPTERMSVFAGISSKNYSYETQDVKTGEHRKRVTKCRGLTLVNKANDKLNTDLMLKLIADLQQGRMVSESILQFRLVINSVTKQINSKEVEKHYKNFCNRKRWYAPEFHSSKLWAFGTTQFDVSFP